MSVIEATPFDPGAPQRARAHARASFARTGSRTEPERLFETGGLRWRFPRSTSPCEAVIVNTGGGVAGGDAYRIELALREGAEVEATTTAAERIYPQETIIFDGASLERRLAVDMAGDASLVLVESLVFGRLARGESRIDARLTESWRIRRDGRLVFADETRLVDAGAALDRMAVGAGARALATIVAAAPGVEARLGDLRAALETASEGVETGASAFDGLIVARLLSASPARLRAAVIASILALGGRRPPRLWQ
jgi:urease accessory protein